MKTAIASALGVVTLSLIASPAFAGSADYYVVLDTVSKKCSVTDTKPTAATKKVLADGKSFPSEEEAKAAMGKAPECAAK